MKWLPTSLGAEPKKVMFLIALVPIGIGAYFWGQSSDTPVTPVSAPTAARTTIPVVEPSVIARPAPRPASRAARNSTDDFRPSLKLPEDFDLSKVDPTLKTDLLAKVREVEAGSSRSLFEFYTPPPPPPPPVTIVPTAPKPDPFQTKAPEGPKPPPPPPPPPPIPLKYYGYGGAPRAGAKLKAYFLEGEEIFGVAENDIIKNRYRIVRIGTTSAEVEDTVSKNKQTLRIVDRCEEASAGCK